MDQEGKLWCRQSEREGCKLVNERGFSRVLGLYKVGSEGLTEVLWSTVCDQYSSGFPHYWNRPHCVYHRMDCWDPALPMCICQHSGVFVHNKLPSLWSYFLDYFSLEPLFTGYHYVDFTMCHFIVLSAFLSYIFVSEVFFLNNCLLFQTHPSACEKCKSLLPRVKICYNILCKVPRKTILLIAFSSA